MADERQTLDRRPGALPDIIRADDGSIKYVMTPAGIQGQQLVIRCDRDGEVWVSIAPRSASSD